MHLIGFPLLLISLVLFFIDFLTVGNLNFTTDPILLRIGQIIGIVAILSIFINLIVVIVDLIKKMRRHSQEIWEKKSPSEKRAFRIKRSIGLLLLLWLLIIFPVIAMSQMGLFPKVFAASQGSLAGMILFLIMAGIGTIIPGIYLSPLIFFVFPLFLLSIYFILSGSWHKWRDTIFIFFILFLIVGQINGFTSLMKPEPTLEDFKGENRLAVTILDKDRKQVNYTEACVSPLINLSQAKCQRAKDDGKVTFMLKAGHYWLGLSFQSMDGYPKTKTRGLDIQEGQTLETELVVEK